MDISTPVKNPNFIKAILLMRQDRTKASQFLIELFKATFLCPGKIYKSNVSIEGDEKLHLGEGSKISLSILETKLNERYLLAFTDWEELRKWKNIQGQETLLFSFEDYQSIVLDNKQQYDGVVINPFGESLVFDRNKMESIYLDPNVIKKNESVMIGEPQNYPQDMVDKLKEYFQSTRLVDKAYLLWMARENETSYLLVLNSKLAPQQLFPKVGEICKPYLNDELLDMVPLNSSFGENAVRNQKPFYQAIKKN